PINKWNTLCIFMTGNSLPKITSLPYIQEFAEHIPQRIATMWGVHSGSELGDLGEHHTRLVMLGFASANPNSIRSSLSVFLWLGLAQPSCRPCLRMRLFQSHRHWSRQKECQGLFALNSFPHSKQFAIISVFLSTLNLHGHPEPDTQQSQEEN